MKKNKAIKYPLLPDAQQGDLIIRTFGCCRNIWNLMLSDREAAYRCDKTVLHPTPAEYKEDHPYLKEVDSLALANMQLHLEEAYHRFFTVKGAGFPKYKSKKRSKKSYTTNNQNGTIEIDIEARTIRLPKVGRVKIVLYRLPEAGWKIKSATVSQESDGSFFCSVLFEYDEEVVKTDSPEQNAVGLDYKSDGLYMDSNGYSCGSPKYYRKAEKKLAKAKRKLRHKDKESRNYEKAMLQVNRIHRHVANQRKDFLHKESTAITKRYDLVAVETLDMKAMSNKSFHNGKATMDNGYGMFLNMLEYKLMDAGKVFVKVDKWFPSSQLCSRCGHQEHRVKDLKMRRWTCPSCCAEHDRDLNAAINIKKEGIRQYLAG